MKHEIEVHEVIAFVRENAKKLLGIIPDVFVVFFFNDTATTEIYTLSLHDALPISWWRADVTGQYGLPAGASPSPPPAFDRDAIAGLVRYAEAGEAGWRDWFAAHSVQPFEITYEDLVKDLDAAVRAIGGFLDVPLPPGLGHIRPRGRRQADHHTERFVRLFNRHAGT